jgi:hypothetical protein
MRKIIELDNLELTQGAIFNNAVAENYANYNAYGLIINARCDLAHQKLRTISYIPIVNLHDWQLTDGKRIVFERLTKEYYSQIGNALNDKGHNKEVIKYIELDNIVSTLVNDDKKIKTILEKIKEISSNISGVYVPEIIASDYAKVEKKLRSELFEYKLSGFHFVETVDDKDFQGFVCLLNEIHSIRHSDSISLAKGFVPSDLLCSNYEFHEEVFTSVIARLRSPYIEHLMQQFAFQFIRVGIDEVDQSSF